MDDTSQQSLAERFNQVAAQRGGTSSPQPTQQPQPSQPAQTAQPSAPSSLEDRFNQVIAERNQVSQTAQPAAPAPAMGPQGIPATTFSASTGGKDMFGVTHMDESTPEGAAKAQAEREAEHPIITAIGKGSGEALGDAWDAVKGIPSGVLHQLPPVALYDSVKQAIPILDAYEKARTEGKGVVDAINAANEQAKKQDALRQSLEKHFAEFKKNPGQESVRGIADAAMFLATMWDGGEFNPANMKVPARPVPPAPHFMFNPESGELVPTGAALPESAVTQAASKSGLSQGASVEVPEVVNDAAQEGVRQELGKTAASAEVAPIEEGASVRGAAGDMAKQIQSRSSAAYKALDEASGGRWQRFGDSIRNLRDKAGELVGIDDEKAEMLERQAQSIENGRDELVKGLVKDGKISPEAATKAAADWKQSQALLDVDKAIKTSTRPATATVGEQVNFKTLETRLQRLQDSGRLSQALGSDGNAESMMSHIREVNDYLSQPPTGQQALKQMAREHLSNGKIDWKGVENDYARLTPAERLEKFGTEAGTARKFISEQAKWQVTKGYLRKGALTLGGLTLGYTAKKLLLDPILSDMLQ